MEHFAFLILGCAILATIKVVEAVIVVAVLNHVDKNIAYMKMMS